MNMNGGVIVDVSEFDVGTYIRARIDGGNYQVLRVEEGANHYTLRHKSKNRAAGTYGYEKHVWYTSDRLSSVKVVQDA